jgi:uncharacterized membrane protein YphA (DoxX/SURF4 family)
MSEPPKPAVLWTGRVLSILPALMLVMSGVMKITHNPEAVDGFVHKFGFDEAVITPIGVLELVCTALYLVPRTAVLGAILLTGYLGGAVVTHLRIGEGAFVAPAIMGAVLWLGLWLRDPRLRDLAPLVRAS